jgi:hypothetical protein
MMPRSAVAALRCAPSAVRAGNPNFQRRIAAGKQYSDVFRTDFRAAPE